MTTPPPQPPWTQLPPPWPWWSDTARRAAGGPDLRVSDAERAAVGDVLARHYGDGRLDDSEFKERIDRAMSAKTRSDLSGLTTDLPRFDAPGPPPVPHRRHWPFVAVVLVAALTVSAVSAPFYAPHVPWLIILIVGALVLRRFSGHSFHHRHHHHDSHSAGSPFA